MAELFLAQRKKTKGSDWTGSSRMKLVALSPGAEQPCRMAPVAQQSSTRVTWYPPQPSCDQPSPIRQPFSVHSQGPCFSLSLRGHRASSVASETTSQAPHEAHRGPLQLCTHWAWTCYCQQLSRRLLRSPRWDGRNGTGQEVVSHTISDNTHRGSTNSGDILRLWLEPSQVTWQ